MTNEDCIAAAGIAAALRDQITFTTRSLDEIQRQAAAMRADAELIARNATHLADAVSRAVDLLDAGRPADARAALLAGLSPKSTNLN